jgi:uncharacterized protein (DUF1330 family)
MNTNTKIALAVVAGAALGAAAMQGLHAQDKLKAYSVAEVETIDTGGQAAYLSVLWQEIEAAGGHSLRTLRGRVVRIDGAPPPEQLSLVEWDSVGAAMDFYKSKAWTDPALERDKVQKTIRLYVVEVEK